MTILKIIRQVAQSSQQWIGVTHSLLPAFLLLISSSVFASDLSDDISKVSQVPEEALTVTPPPETDTKPEAFKKISAYRAEYDLKSDRYKISPTATRNLDIDENGMATLSQSASILVASINQESVFKISPSTCQIESKNYAYQRTVMGKKKNYRIEFDYSKNTYLENYDGETQTKKFKTELYDELSYQEVLRCELQNLKDFTTGTQFSYNVRTKGKNKLYTFEISGQEILDTALGKVETVKVSRLRDNKDKGDNSFIWFSKEHNFLLVKLVQEDDDDKLSLKISKPNN